MKSKDCPLDIVPAAVLKVFSPTGSVLFKGLSWPLPNPLGPDLPKNLIWVSEL